MAFKTFSIIGSLTCQGTPKADTVNMPEGAEPIPHFTGISPVVERIPWYFLLHPLLGFMSNEGVGVKILPWFEEQTEDTPEWAIRGVDAYYKYLDDYPEEIVFRDRFTREEKDLKTKTLQERYAKMRHEQWKNCCLLLSPSSSSKNESNSIIAPTIKLQMEMPGASDTLYTLLVGGVVRISMAPEASSVVIRLTLLDKRPLADKNRLDQNPLPLDEVDYQRFTQVFQKDLEGILDKGNWGGPLVTQIADRAFRNLLIDVERVYYLHTPIPCFSVNSAVFNFTGILGEGETVVTEPDLKFFAGNPLHNELIESLCWIKENPDLLEEALEKQEYKKLNGAANLAQWLNDSEVVEYQHLVPMFQQAIELLAFQFGKIQGYDDDFKRKVREARFDLTKLAHMLGKWGEIRKDFNDQTRKVVRFSKDKKKGPKNEVVREVQPDGTTIEKTVSRPKKSYIAKPAFSPGAFSEVYFHDDFDDENCAKLGERLIKRFHQRQQDLIDEKDLKPGDTYKLGSEERIILQDFGKLTEAEIRALVYEMDLHKEDKDKAPLWQNKVVVDSIPNQKVNRALVFLQEYRRRYSGFKFFTEVFDKNASLRELGVGLSGTLVRGGYMLYLVFLDHTRNILHMFGLTSFSLNQLKGLVSQEDRNLDDIQIQASITKILAKQAMSTHVTGIAAEKNQPACVDPSVLCPDIVIGMRHGVNFNRGRSLSRSVQDAPEEY